jgi:hypothetical protein
VTPWNPRRGRDLFVVEAPVRVEGPFGDLHFSLCTQVRCQLSAYVFSYFSSFGQLSFAELRTSSPIPLVLPPSLYLPHQFSFHALDGGYHGWLRRFQLDVLGTKIEALKQSQISAFSSYVDHMITGASSFSTKTFVSRGHQPPVTAARGPHVPDWGAGVV